MCMANMLILSNPIVLEVDDNYEGVLLAFSLQE